MITTVLTWLIIVVGLATSATFFVWHRPARPWRTQAKIVTLLVALPSLMYLRSAIVLAIHGGRPRLTGVVDSVISIGTGAVIDALFIWLVVALRTYRHHWEEELR
jgi:hypothetical protein